MKNVSKSINGKNIIKDLSLSIQNGEIYAFLGPNGSGKSTTIKLLNGLLKADEGKILIFNKVLEEQSKQRIGILSDSTLLYEQLTAMQNLIFFGEIYGMKRSEVIKKSEELLHHFKLYQYKDSKIQTFSTGMKKRIQLIKSVIHNPSLLFLDEPTSGLDPESCKEVNDYISHLSKEEGKTIFICSHQLDELQFLADRFGFISKGKVFAEGSLNDLTKRFHSTLKIKTNTQNLNKDILKSYRYEIEGELLNIHYKNNDDLSKILSNLLNNGINIIDIENKKYSLKDIYFALLEESKHDTVE